MPAVLFRLLRWAVDGIATGLRISDARRRQGDLSMDDFDPTQPNQNLRTTPPA